MREERDINNIRARNGASNAWQGIVSAVDILKRGWRKLPRNGKNTLFWEDVWIIDEPLKDLARKSIPLLICRPQWQIIGMIRLDRIGTNWRDFYRIMLSGNSQALC